MQCTLCNSDLTSDSDLDSGSISAECIVENFKCTNIDCGAEFEIEFTPINITEIS